MSDSDRNEKKECEASHNNKGQPPGISLDAAQKDKGLFAAFLSYSRQDQESADRLIKLLKAKEASIAFDQDDIRGGEDWRRKLKSLIEHSRNVVFLISPASLVSQMCHWELDLSVTLNKRANTARGR